VLFIVAFATIFLLFPAFSSLLTDWWWFREVGYQVVFTREIVTRLILFLVAGVLTSSVIYANMRVAQRGMVRGPLIVPFGENVPRLELPGGFRHLTIPVALGFGVVAGLIGSSSWSLVLQLMNRTPFGITDPVFSRDIGFYVFTLPGIAALLGFLSGLATIALLVTLPLYVLRGRIAMLPRQLRIDHAAGLHLAILIAISLVLTALRLWLVDIPELLYSTTGPLVGASYTDLHGTLPAIHLSAVLALVAAVLVVMGGLRSNLPRYAVAALVGYFGLTFVARGIFPQVMQKFVVAPTELTREMPYLRHHIAATRQAWGLDSVESRELQGEANLTLADIKANAPTIENVRLWDREPLLQTFGQLQEIRTYYDFVSVDDDRYQIDGKYRQVLLSPRELNSASLPTRTFINEHLTFTHGMGLTLGPVNQVTVEGLPVLFVKDLPPVSAVSLKITRPQIYYGELSNDWVVVGTRQREFDHPSGDQNVYEAYQGTGGVPTSSLWRRLLYASRFAASNVLFSQDITDRSRVLYYRNIKVRATKALPMLRFDRDPYMIIAADGKLVWMLDAYTATDRYPYAQRLEDGTTYMRNSAKVVIDAYDGSIKAYISVPADPLIRTWARIFPGIFSPLDSMPADLRAHLRYPDELFRAQASLYTTYHMDAAEDFYHREDQWQIPVTEQPDGNVPFMRHIVMRLPDEKEAEFIYMVPFSPRGKDNLAAWMVARNDGMEYGKLRVYQLSRQSLVFGPRQIENRINQNTEISRQVSLWDQRGSKVLRGDLLVIPIEESLLYVQPLYLQAEGGRIPELKRVVVAYQNQVVMESTLEGALASLFGSATGTKVAATSAVADSLTAAGPLTVGAALQPLIDEARRRYQNAIEAQREGDWARYGAEIKQLGQVLERIGAGGGKAKR
jgi:hypothetical protein